MVVLLHEPDALLVQKVLVAERPDRAEIDDAAGHFIGKRMPRENVDFLVGAAIDDHQLAGAGDLAREADAAGTHHAAIDEERDRVAHRPLAAREGADVGPALVPAMLEVVVLKVALAGLVADRAV